MPETIAEGIGTRERLDLPWNPRRRATGEPALVIQILRISMSKRPPAISCEAISTDDRNAGRAVKDIAPSGTSRRQGLRAVRNYAPLGITRR
jgi:hypothetical protein